MLNTSHAKYPAQLVSVISSVVYVGLQVTHLFHLSVMSGLFHVEMQSQFWVNNSLVRPAGVLGKTLSNYYKVTHGGNWAIAYHLLHKS